MKALERYLRYRKHIDTIEKRVVELRNKVCKQALLYGNVDEVTRELYFKYNQYLQYINPN